ncbi:MAG: HAD family hydrolase [Fimbriiglobus sp.]|jgi:putative hydrolase of the HAD superfamily|nr:HAD family hydrolase [Fimbriiglobus sp.]
MKAVFFDAVGTVIFPARSASEVYVEAARRHGLDPDPDAVRARLWAHFRVEEIRDRELNWVTSEVREQERWRSIVFAAIDGATDALFAELYYRFAQPFAWIVPPAAAECIARLVSRGVVVGMGSNYDSRLEGVVGGTPALRPLRERLVISSLVGIRKPGSAFFEAVVRAAGCDPSDILFVGDDVDNDYYGASAAGMRAVLLDEHGKHDHIPHRVRSLAELE